MIFRAGAPGGIIKYIYSIFSEKETNTMKKLIPAICLLLVSAVMLGTSTFAWFSMNATVAVTGKERPLTFR